MQGFLCYLIMPGLICRSVQPCNPHPGSIPDCCTGSALSIRRDDDVDVCQLKKFWGELSTASRCELLRIDKHSFFEQVRRNMYCSRCNGLLLEAFSQIVAYSRSLGAVSSCHHKHASECIKGWNEDGDSVAASISENDIKDPSVHPWGGLIATRDNRLTLLDCFIEGQPLEVIQNVCDCARIRERERELLYPDACGGGGRGWISHNTCRGHNIKETCALHTVRLSCGALVDFWSALGEETRRSLLRMKEEDFVSCLMYRFDSKRFCRDCRRNVLRELKELKELKRSRKDLKCTKWFCTADTAFGYEVSNTTVQANWRECFGLDLESTYQNFEWGLGSAEGTCDILEFEDVGLAEGARIDGLDLAQVSSFYITLRAWKHDGRCTELSVKAHGLNGRQCVHRRLLVGDGHVTITKGESIRRFFEEAEEAEEEEDEEVMDKNGNETENDGFRVQRHARSPELARDFLLDAATIIFKEQVEKAFREGTARQNAHTVFVCLALNLLEERIHIACKEINMLEKQKQLLEEEENEKQEEEKKKERKKMKEKEKKMRKKQKQKGREHEKKEEAKIIGTGCSDLNTETASLIGENDEACSDNGISIFNRMMRCDSTHVMGQTSSSEMVEALQPLDTNGDLTELDVSAPDSKDALESEHCKITKRRPRIRNGTLVKIVPHISMKKTHFTSLDFDYDSRCSLNSTCPSVIESAEKSPEGSRKHSRKVVKPERWDLPSSTGTSNNIKLKERCSRYVYLNPSKRPIYVESKENDTRWAGKGYSTLKNVERKNMVIKSSKQTAKAVDFVAGSMQCNWQIVRASADATFKRGFSDQKCSSLENEIHDIPEAEHAQDLVTVSSESVDSDVVSDKSSYSLHGLSEMDRSVATVSSESLDCPDASDRMSFTVHGVSEKDEFSSSEEVNSSVSLESSASLGYIDEDASPSSTTSFFTDITGTGDANRTTTESSSTVEASVVELLNSVQNPVGELQYDGNVDRRAFRRFQHQEYYPCNYYEQIPLGMGMEVPIIDVASQNCELDPIIHVPLASTPILPTNLSRHPPGYHWLQSEYTGTPVLGTGMFPFPQPQNLYSDFQPQSVSTMVPLSIPFHVEPPVLGFTCMPAVPAEPNFTWWGGQQYILADQQNVGLLSSGDNYQQLPLAHQCASEEQSDFLSSNDANAISISSAPLNDPLGFSLFHFHSLPGADEQVASDVTQENSNGVTKLLGLSCSRSAQQEAAKSNIHVEEYSLFATSSSNRFAFF